MVPLSGPPRLKEAKASQSSSTAPRPVLTYPPSPFLFSKSPSGYYYSFFLFLSHVSLRPFHWTLLFPHSLSLFLFLFFILSLDLWWLLDFWGAELWCIARAVILICSHVAKLSLSYSVPCFFFQSHQWLCCREGNTGLLDCWFTVVWSEMSQQLLNGLVLVHSWHTRKSLNFLVSVKRLIRCSFS